MNNKPKDILINKAIAIWKDMLRSPEYDNGDTSDAGFMGTLLVKMLPNNSSEDVLDKFGEYLKESLSNPNESGYYDTWLDVDYGPCKILHDAAEKAGLKTQFPWKTTVSIHENDLSVKCGYGAESVYYYPIDGNKWLVTKLYGSDISKVIEYVTGGKPDFTIE